MPTSEDRFTLSRAETIPTSMLADCLRDNGYPNQVMGPEIQGINRVVSRVAGWAYTIVGGPHDSREQGPDLTKARAIDEMPPGSFAVWAGGNVEDVCLLGDLLAAAMQVRGVRGVVVDGGVRDIDEINESGLAVHARYRTPRASTGVWRVRGVQVTAELRGTLGVAVQVEPGDLIVADANGVVCVPHQVIEDVLAAAEGRMETDVQVRSRIRRGENVGDLMREFGRI